MTIELPGGAVGNPFAVVGATTHIPVDVLAGYDDLYCLPHQEPAAHLT